jgi:uncharacterized protein (TIGR00369 family)
MSDPDDPNAPTSADKLKSFLEALAPDAGEARLLALMNGQKDGWGAAMGLVYVRATPELVVARWTVGKHHLQPAGLVHGGVHCGVIESVCSIGASIAAASRGHRGQVVGLENHTSFLRAMKLGATLEATATPLTRGRTTHVWEARIREVAREEASGTPEPGDGALVARGTVRLLLVAST